MNEIDIADIDQGELLAALYNNAEPRGLGHLHADDEVMTAEEAQAIINSGGRSAELRAMGFTVADDATEWKVDYVKGRPIKIGVRNGKLIGARSYDRDNGQGSCLRIVEELRAKAQK